MMETWCKKANLENSTATFVACVELGHPVKVGQCGPDKCNYYEKPAEAPNMALVEEFNEKGKNALKGAVKEALAEMGVVGNPQTLQVKCQRIDCLHNWSHWCQKEDGKIGVDESGYCKSFGKF